MDALKKAPTYRIGDSGKNITCLRCGMTSFNVNDIRFLYCGNCHKFHEEPSTLRAPKIRSEP